MDLQQGIRLKVHAREACILRGRLQRLVQGPVDVGHPADGGEDHRGVLDVEAVAEGAQAW